MDQQFDEYQKAFEKAKTKIVEFFTPQTEKKSVAIGLVILAVYGLINAGKVLYKELSFIQFAFDFGPMGAYVPLKSILISVLMLISSFLILRAKPFAWSVFCFSSFAGVLSAFSGIYFAITWVDSGTAIDALMFDLLDIGMGRALMALLISLLIFGFLNSNDVKKLFNVTKRRQLFPPLLAILIMAFEIAIANYSN